MPYIQVDVDAIDAFDEVATMSGISQGDAAIGLLKLWKHCWKKKVSHVSRERLETFFPQAPAKLLKALAVCEFVDTSKDEEGPDEVHVRGAEKRLGVLKARSEGGKKASKNLKQFSGSTSGSVPAQAGREPELEPVGSSGTAPGLTPTTQHPTSNIGKEPPPTPSELPEPAEPLAEVVGENFWDTDVTGLPVLRRRESIRWQRSEDGLWEFLQLNRQRHGLEREARRSKGFREWAGPALFDPGPAAIERTHTQFLQDRSIRAPGHPTSVFISKGIWEARRPAATPQEASP